MSLRAPGEPTPLGSGDDRHGVTDLGARPGSGWAAIVEPLAAVLLLLTVVVTRLAEVETALAIAPGLFIAGAGLAYLGVVLNPQRGGISLMVSFFFLFFVAIPATIQTRAYVFPFKSVFFRAELVEGFFLMSVAQLSYLLAVLASSRRSREVVRDREAHGMRPGFWLRSAAALTGFSYVIAMAVGPASLLLTRGERGAAAVELGARVSVIFVGRSISLLAILIVLYLFVAHPGLRQRAAVWLLLVATAVVFLLLNYPPGLARFQLMGSALALVAVLVSLFAGRIKVLAATAAPLFLVFFFATLKGLGRGDSVEFAGSFDRDVTNYLTRVDFDAFKQVVDTWVYVDAGNPMRFGENFVGVLFFWVPRQVWPGKPLDSGLIVSFTLNYPFNNVSSPLPAEAYISFGLTGVVVVMALAGLAVSWIETQARLAQAAGGMRQAVLLYALTVGFSTIILRGAINGVAPMFATGFMAYFLLAWLHNRSGSRTRSEPSESGAYA